MRIYKYGILNIRDDIAGLHPGRMDSRSGNAGYMELKSMLLILKNYEMILFSKNQLHH